MIKQQKDNKLTHEFLANALLTCKNMVVDEELERYEDQKKNMMEAVRDVDERIARAKKHKVSRVNGVDRQLAILRKNKTISEVYLDRGRVLIVTPPLKYAPSSDHYTAAWKGLLLGRMLLVIPLFDYRTDNIKVYGLDYVLSEGQGYYRPMASCVGYDNGICYGNNKDVVKSLLERGDLANLLPYLIKSIVSPDYEAPFFHLYEVLDLAFYNPVYDQYIAIANRTKSMAEAPFNSMSAGLFSEYRSSGNVDPEFYFNDVSNKALAKAKKLIICK